MRRWLALLAGVAAIALTGTALALTGPDVIDDEETATETTVKTETTTTTIEEPVKAEHFVFDDFEKDEVAWEAPERSIPIEPRDHIPPEIAILHPEDGQIFEHNEVVFEGSSEPGSTVFVGEKRADVGDDGSWRIVLHLAAGENLVTAKSVDEYGKHATDSVTVIYQAPEPKKEEPKKEEPKEEEPKEHQVEWEFSAYQVYGECSENPPYDVFYGTGKPGSLIQVVSEDGSGSREINEHGEWEIKVVFESALVGKTFAVKVKDEFGHEQVFEFTRTD